MVVDSYKGRRYVGEEKARARALHVRAETVFMFLRPITFHLGGKRN